MSQLINIFLEPAKVFAELREKPTFLLPALLAIAATTAAACLYFFQVDPEWFANYQFAAAGSEMTAAEIEQAKKIMPGARTLGIISAITTPIMFALVFSITALYYLLAGKVTGKPVTFRHGLALATWASVPTVLGAVVAIVGLYTSSSNQMSFESLQMLNVDPLFVQLPLDHDWAMLARSFSLLNIWVWFLAALGWKTWFRTGWGSALFVVLLPYLVIYGAMALFALI
jgi:hypothetical protein